MYLNLQTFYRDYKISVSVQIYRHRNLQRKCRHFTEIKRTFLKSVNGSSFPVKAESVMLSFDPPVHVSHRTHIEIRGNPAGNNFGPELTV